MLQKALSENGLGEQIAIQFFPDNQLGQEIDVINSVKLGVIDMMISGTSISANLVPLVSVLDLGYLFQSFPQQARALDAGAGRPIEDALLRGAGIHVIAWSYNFGARSVLAKKAVSTPEELAGLKIRTLPNPVITECLRLMGAAATPLAFGGIYTALQAGVLDGLEHDPPIILASKFYKTAKFYALTGHIFSPLVAYFSDLTFKRMDPKLRDGFLDVAKRAAVAHRAHGLAAEQEALNVLKASGVTVTACDKAALRSRCCRPHHLRAVAGAGGGATRHSAAALRRCAGDRDGHRPVRAAAWPRALRRLPDRRGADRDDGQVDARLSLPIARLLAGDRVCASTRHVAAARNGLLS